MLPKDINPLDFFFLFRFFENDSLDIMIHGLVIMLLPGYILHYFLVFHKKKYQQFTKKYKSREGKLFNRYMSNSIVISFSLFVITFIFNHLVQ